MSAWIDAGSRLPETLDDDYESLSRVVLIRVEGLPYTARMVGADLEMGTAAHWRLLGRDGYTVELDEVREWCEVPA